MRFQYYARKTKRILGYHFTDGPFSIYPQFIIQGHNGMVESNYA